MNYARLRRLRFALASALYATLALNAIDIAIAANNAHTYLFFLISLYLISHLCVIDGKLRNRPLLHISAFLVFITSGLLSLYYLLRGRSLWSSSKVLMHGIAAYVIIPMGFYIPIFVYKYGFDALLGK